MAQFPFSKRPNDGTSNSAPAQRARVSNDFFQPRPALQQVAQQPAVPQPAVPQPAVPQPAVPQPAVPQPAVPQPAVPQPAVPQPAVPQPAVPRQEAEATWERYKQTLGHFFEPQAISLLMMLFGRARARPEKVQLIAVIAQFIWELIHDNTKHLLQDPSSNADETFALCIQKAMNINYIKMNHEDVKTKWTAHLRSLQREAAPAVVAPAVVAPVVVAPAVVAPVVVAPAAVAAVVVVVAPIPVATMERDETVIGLRP